MSVRPIRLIARFAIAPIATLALAAGQAPAAQAEGYFVPGGLDVLTTTQAAITVAGFADAIDFVGCGTQDDTQVARGDVQGMPTPIQPSDQFQYAAAGSTTTTLVGLCLESTQSPGGGRAPSVPLFVTLQSNRTPAEQATFGPGMPSVGTLHLLFLPGGQSGIFNSVLNVNYDVRSGCSSCAILAPGLSTGPITATSVPWKASVAIAPPTEPFCHSSGAGAGHLHCVQAHYPGDFVPGAGPEQCVPGLSTATTAPCLSDVMGIGANAPITAAGPCGLAVCWVGGAAPVATTTVTCSMIYSDTSLPNRGDATSCGVASFGGTFFNVVCGTGAFVGTMTGMTENNDTGAGSATFTATFFGGIGLLTGTATEANGPPPNVPYPAAITGLMVLTPTTVGAPTLGPGNGACLSSFPFQSVDFITESSSTP